MEYYDPREYDLAGRIAKLRTKHGIIETPYLFPVIDPKKQIPAINVLEEISTVKYPISWFPPWIEPPEPNVTSSTIKINELKAPIYNIVLVLLKDANGNLHIAIWYPHSIVIGDKVPEDLPVRRITMLRRLGMIDYYVTIYIWRRSM